MSQDDKNLDQQTVLVIGGSSGIGHEVAHQARTLGARLVLTGRDQTRLTAAADRLGGDQEVQALALDAHDEAALANAFQGLEAIDHIVSMVGDSMAGGFLTTQPQTMRHVLHSKFWTNWLIGKHAARTLRDGGSLTFTSGTGGRPHDVSATYVANLGIGALVQGLAVELAPRVRVNAVAPTFMGTATSFWRNTPADELQDLQAAFTKTVPLGRLGNVEQVASAYIHLMTNTFITGQILPVDGGVMLQK